MEDMKISIFRPRIDQCDTCFKFKNGNLSEEDYREHRMKKDLARNQKEEDKKMAVEGKIHAVTMDGITPLFTCKCTVL